MATAAAAIAGRLRREVEDHFFDNEAFSPDRAVDFEPRASVQERYLDQLMAEGVLFQVSDGRYWFDLKRYRQLRHQQFIWSMRVLALGAVVFAMVFVVQYFLKH